MMKKIAIISDTHNYLDDKILKLTNNCDQIWHAGDFGYSIKISEFIHKKFNISINYILLSASLLLVVAIYLLVKN